VVETGIKVIDLLCPWPAGGIVGIFGDMHTGKMVVVEELVHRLAGAPVALSLLVFVEASADVTAIPRLDYRTSDSVEAIYLPVADADPRAAEQTISQLDAALTLSGHLARNSLYPAIDPVRLTSLLLDPTCRCQCFSRPRD
jgi:F0F1-type ATP synthase beta subunit